MNENREILSYNKIHTHNMECYCILRNADELEKYLLKKEALYDYHQEPWLFTVMDLKLALLLNFLFT